jgi:hypothetical protein
MTMLAMHSHGLFARGANSMHLHCSLSLGVACIFKLAFDYRYEIDAGSNVGRSCIPLLPLLPCSC